MDVATIVTLGVGVVVLVTLVASLVVLQRARARAERRLTASQADVESLRERVDDLSRQIGGDAGPVRDDPREFLITSLPGATDVRGPAVPHGTVPATTLSARQFTTVAIGESLVRVLSLGYGVQRALSAESRNRIRFEMRQEVRRSRRRRRRELKEAKRHLRTPPTGESTSRTEDAA
jgi:hypothetical protein